MERLRAKYLILIGLVTLLMSGIVLAQDSGTRLVLQDVNWTEFPRVVMRYSTWDESGLPLVGLKAQDFLIQESSLTPVHPQSVIADANSPLQVMLVIDASGSMRGFPITDAKIAAARFLDRLGRKDHAGVLAFSDTIDTDPAILDPDREQSPSTNLELVYDLVEDISSGGGTHLYNAVAKAIQLLADAPPGHRAVLLLSDGRNDPATTGDPEKPIILGRQYNVPVFVIGLGWEIDEPYLRRLADETGGLYRHAPRSAELASLFADMATLLKTQYVLTYESGLPPDGQVHPIKVWLGPSENRVGFELSIGPLPFLPTPTELPPSPTPRVTVSPTQTPASPVAEVNNISTPMTIPTPAGSSKETSSILSWLMMGAFIVGIGVVLLGRRRASSQGDFCASCGFDMTGQVGACPQCGSTKRLPVRK
jgi:Mg-chelatase subunit ChlD